MALRLSMGHVDEYDDRVAAFARQLGLTSVQLHNPTNLPEVHGYWTYESLAYRPDRWPPVLADLLTRFWRCLIPEGLANPVMFTYLGRCLVAGGTAVIADGLGLAEAIERFRITATVMPPARRDQVLCSGAELPSLRAVVLGGSPAGAQLLGAAERLGPVVWQEYGQGEAGVIFFVSFCRS